MNDATYKRRGWSWLYFTKAEYIPPRGDGWFRWSINIGPLELARVARDPWDYFVLRTKRHALHFGDGWRKHTERIRSRF